MSTAHVQKITCFFGLLDITQVLDPELTFVRSRRCSDNQQAHWPGASGMTYAVFVTLFQNGTHDKVVSSKENNVECK